MSRVTCHSYVSRDVTSKKTITTKLGGNTYQNEMVAYIYMTWPNHAKVIKATVPKVALFKRYTVQQVT